MVWASMPCGPRAGQFEDLRAAATVNQQPGPAGTLEATMIG
jgi:hypothetical protein